MPIAPKWWRAGHARQRPGSIAEAELLSHLALLLQPQEPLKEVFRNFPAEKSDKWGKNLVSPDMAVYGALKLNEAALFLEYDGYYRHNTSAGRLADVRKSKALLMNAPAGSQVLRVAHGHRGLKFACETREVIVDSWQVGQGKSILVTVGQVVEKLLAELAHVLKPKLNRALQDFLVSPGNLNTATAVEFTQNLLAERTLRVNMSSVHNLLRMRLNISSSRANWLRDQLGNRGTALVAYTSADNCGRIIWKLRDLGLQEEEIYKAIARNPKIMGRGFEENLHPAVQWFRDLSLKKAEVAKVIARNPQVLGYSIEENMKPTVQWFRDLGLKQTEVAKVIARNPQVLGYSIEENLKPKVQWLAGLGLSQCQIISVAVSQPQLFNLSISRNLSRKISLLRQFVPAGQAATLLTRYPVLFTCGYERWAYRFGVLRENGELSKFASAMILTDENFSRRFVGRHESNRMPICTCKL